MKKENKALVKYFVLVFLIAALLINWNDISWLFNYRVIFGLISSQFQQKIIAENFEIFKKKEVQRPIKDSEPTDKKNSLEIPKIEISVPLIVSENATQKDLNKLLDSGVVYFPGSVLPGEEGQTIILGHSAPPGWPKIKHDWVFTRLNELVEGDEVFVYFEGRKYTYRMTEKFFLDKGEELPQVLTGSDNVLVLISCWPPGKDLRRIAVLAK